MTIEFIFRQINAIFQTKLLNRISFKTFLFTKTYYYNMKSIKILKYILSKLNHKFQKINALNIIKIKYSYK